ncbi:MAG: cupin domain-containing protein [Chloroflexi bacterium]|nr:MAG: cupin domain-containing protein [Chloroflexota bacterium]
MTDTAYTYVACLSDLVPEVPSDSILSRTVYHDDRVKVVLFGFAAGQELSEHTASQPAILHFLEGEAHLTLGEDSMEAHAGTWVHMPPQLPHSIVAKTPVVMLLLLLKDR